MSFAFKILLKAVFFWFKSLIDILLLNNFFIKSSSWVGIRDLFGLSNFWELIFFKLIFVLFDFEEGSIIDLVSYTFEKPEVDVWSYDLKNELPFVICIFNLSKDEFNWFNPNDDIEYLLWGDKGCIFIFYFVIVNYSVKVCYKY